MIGGGYVLLHTRLAMPSVVRWQNNIGCIFNMPSPEEHFHVD